MTAPPRELTYEQLRAIQELAPIELARRGELRPTEFAIYGSRRTWMPARHLDLLELKLFELAGGDLKRLRVFEPPRHGKSLFCSTYFPAWFIGTRVAQGLPARVILASYEHDFATSWGARARDVIRRVGPQLWGIKVGKDRADDWQIAGHEAGMVSAGVGGPITGRGADLFIIDDPVKGPEEAGSEAMREKAWAWYTEVAMTRLEPGGRMLLIMTRWNEDDLAGRIQDRTTEDGIPWYELRLPALAEEDDILGREVGEALWPERFPADEADRIRMGLPEGTETLLQRKQAMGSNRFEALYQQNPGPPEGALIMKSWWHYYDEPPRLENGELDLHEQLISVDCAFNNTKHSSYVVMQVWGRKYADIYLLDQRRERMDFPTTCKKLRALSAQWPKALIKLVERKANGEAVITTLQHEIQGIVPETPTESKEGRVHSITGLIEAGNVHLPRGAAWVEDFVEECGTFPFGRYNDQVDAMSQGLKRLLRSVRREPKEDPELPTGRTKEIILARHADERDYETEEYL